MSNDDQDECDTDDQESLVNEGPDSFDLDDSETVPCPHCRKPVHDTSEWCPECGQYLSDEQVAPRSFWWVLVVLTLLLLIWLFGTRL